MSIAATMTRAYGESLEPRIPSKRGKARSIRSVRPRARRSAAAQTRCEPLIERGRGPRLLDGAEADHNRVIPAAGDKVCLCPLVVDPGHLVHEAACLCELCGTFDLGQGTSRLVPDEDPGL